ncbi:hypothetical protein NQ314_010658 [Rhamnusium bicolor]|uniref:Uncharacterized protein n=1 Tax=Rhamnusium bicolor TaxID=1586634 RepID=A0AAV8XQP4_9CUCU|nr:hypothetical protein NQ314_010658 [Rhamnusium bicolor]
MESRIPERRRQIPQSKKKPRSDSKAYFLITNSGTKARVRKKFFLKTLCISKEVVEHAFEKKGTGALFIGEDNRGKKEPHNKTKPEEIEKVKMHIESFPVMESHYTRKSTRQYLDSKLTIAKMHSLYQEICEKEACKPVSLITYRRIFCQNYNYSFFKPKKDQCQICMSYKSRGLEKTAELESKYRDHVARKEDCNTAKIKDKERSLKEKNLVCCTFDLQRVLQIPTSDVSPMYSRKICTYNLTVYELAPPNNAFCYSWTELNGKRGSLEIGTCLYKYINQLPNTVSELVLFSDTCSGQNRNQNVSAMLLYMVQKKH